MIVYELKCSRGHVFEGWFRNSDSFDDQAAAGEVPCAVCGDRKVEKAPMAPRLSRGRSAEPAAEAAREGQRERPAGPPAQAVAAGLPAEALALLTELRRKVESECDYVGEKFAEEARKIHYGEAEQRGIYGEASDS